MHLDDTIAALSSAPGAGPRAVVRLSGPATARVLRAVCPGWSPPVRRRVSAEALMLEGVHAPLPADVSFWPAPATYTGQDVAEIHTVSSPPLVELLLAQLLAAGARAAGPGEFTQRAFLAGKKDLTQAEAVMAVVDASTGRDLKDALAQLAGGLAQPLTALRDDLLNLLADVEAALDFADEDLEFVARPEQLLRIGAGLAHLNNLARQLRDRGVSGRGVRVVLAGEPNAGKSRLFNALTGGAALVSDVAGTTRDYLTRTAEVGGVACEFVDTAGVRAAADAIEAQAQALGGDQARRAELLLWCHPAADPAPPAPPPSAADLTLRVATKSDLAPAPPGRVPCSALSEAGLAPLRAALAEAAQRLARPPLAPSQSRCRAHLAAALAALQRAHEHAREADPPELLALALREALHEVGAMSGAVYTNDLLDRIFSRFCIGK